MRSWVVIVLLIVSVPLYAGLNVDMLRFTLFTEPHPAQQIRNNPSKIVLLSFEFPNVETLETNVILSGLTLAPQSTDLAENLIFEKPAVFYPSPLPSSQPGNLGYQINKQADIELQIYNIRGQLIYQESYLAGMGIGGMLGYNSIKLDFEALGLGKLPSSVYFFVLIHKDDVVQKGKFAVLP